MNKQDIIDAAMQIAGGVGNDITQSVLADSDMTAEDLLPLAARYVVKAILAEGKKSFQDVARKFDITVTLSGGNLSGTVPADMLTESLENAFLPSFPYSSKARTYADYQRHKVSNLLTYWVIYNGQFITNAGAGVVPTPTTVSIIAPAIPSIPSDPTTAITATDEFLNRWIYTLAMALRGELKLY